MTGRTCIWLWALCVAQGLFSASDYESVPWTKTLLESRLSFSAEDALRRGQHRCVGGVQLSTAPLRDWEFDVGLSARSLSTQALSLRGERQIYSDLESSPLAVTAVLRGRVSARQRAYQPIYFEMAQKSLESGIGLGRHLIIRKTFFTQLFSYLHVGCGSSSSRWASLEIGVSHVWLSRHIVRCSYTRIQAFGGHEGHFRGIGSLRAGIDRYGVSYTYRFGSGVEGRVSLARRMTHSRLLGHSTVVNLGLSIPLSL